MLFTGSITDVSADGAVFSATFKNIDPERVTELGFVWGTSDNLTVDSPYKYNCIFEKGKEYYSFRNTNSLQPGAVYYVQSYIRYGSSVYYGKAVSFYSMGSQPPKIVSMTPSSAWFGDTVRIKLDEAIPVAAPLSVYFNEQPSKIVGSKDSSLLVIVPELSTNNSYFKDGNTTVLLYRFTLQAKLYNDFTINPPVIDSSTPTEIPAYNLLTITGKGFLPKSTEVFIGGIKCKTNSIEHRKIICRVPASFEDIEDSLKLLINGKYISNGKIKILAPRINKHYPDSTFSYENLSFTGKNLANEELSIKIGDQNATILYRSDDSIVVEAVGRLCGNRTSVDMQIENLTKKHTDNLPLLKPANFEIKQNYQKYYNGNITVKGNYFPEAGPYVYVNNIPYSWYYMQFNKNAKSELNIYIRESFAFPDGYLSLKVNFCDSTEIKLDSVYHIPAPEIKEYDSVVYNYSVNFISCENVNPFAETNKIFIDNALLRTQVATEGTKLLYFPYANISEGKHTLRISTNEQLSNQVDIRLVNRWKNESPYPKTFSEPTKGFMLGDDIYVNSKVGNDPYYFCSYNIKSKIWQRKAKLPTSVHAFVCDSTYAYLFQSNFLYRYTPQSDKWELISSLDTSITGGSYNVNSFYYSGKLYFFTYAWTHAFFKYDLSTGEWSKISASIKPGLQSLHSAITLVDDKVYILNYGNYVVLDLITEQYSSKIALPQYSVFDDYLSLNGFEYNGEIYYYDYDKWRKYNPENGMLYNEIFGPRVENGNYVFRKGSKAYLLKTDGLMEFDLTLQ